MGNLEKAVQFMLDIANDDTHGYDQTRRNGPNFDCSSLLGTALNKAGFNVSPYSWTGNLRKQLLDNGFEEIDVKAERKRGDIFLSENHHTVMCIDGDNVVHASINEKGTTTGGKSGDQTGKEICTRTFYTPKYGWDYHFRLKEETKVVETPTIIKEVSATKHAKKFDRFIADTYVVTASWLNVRNGAGITHKVLATIPKGTKVVCYGYYTLVGKTKWLLCQFVYKGVKYTGFLSKEHVK